MTHSKNSLTQEFRQEVSDSKNRKTELAPLGFSRTHFSKKASEHLEALINLGKIPNILLSNSSHLSHILNGVLIPKVTKRTENSKTDKREETELYLKAKTLFSSFSCSCNSIWISWIFCEFRLHLEKSLKEENWEDSFRRAKWSPIQTEKSTENSENEILIPSQASSYLYSLLFSVAKEMNSVSFDFSNNPVHLLSPNSSEIR